MGEKQPIEPPERDDPSRPLSTEALQQQLGNYANKLTEQRQEQPRAQGAEGDKDSSDTSDK